MNSRLTGKARLTLLTLLLLISLPAAAIRPLSDNAKISLLTCSPGELIYELFGHSAIRVCDPENHLDIIFNYGYFDFYSDNFIINFVSGQTDYTIGISSYLDFCAEYAARGSSVTECVLNLDKFEKQRLWNYLNINMLPQNRIYRYNFVFENCATKIRDAVEAVVSDSIAYTPPFEAEISYRDAIKLYTENAQWSQFGFDICLGDGADEPADTYHLTFLPEIMDRIYSESYIVSSADSQSDRALCADHSELIAKTKIFEPAAISPLAAMWALFACVLILSVLQYFLKWNLNWLDAVLFTINALIGCVIFYLMFFSEHPFTSSNYNIIWLNPLMIVPLFIYKTGKKFSFAYYAVVSIVLAVFMLAIPLIPQHFNPAFYPLMAVYMLRAVCNLVIRKNCLTLR